MAMFTKLMLISTVANKRFGLLINAKIFSSGFFEEFLNSSISVGESEKKADSAAETNAVMHKSNIIDAMETPMLIVKGLKIIPSKRKLLERNKNVPGRSNENKFS